MLGVIAALFVLEVGLRIIDPFEFRVRGNEITLPSNARYVTTNAIADKLDETIVHSKNSLGFRGANPPEEFDQSLSIIAVGGSTTESHYQSDDVEWVALLGRKLEEQFRSVWINNAGLDGHSTFGHRILLRDLVAPIRPKVVLFLVGINEVGRDMMIIDEQKMREALQTDSPLLALLTIANNSEVLTLAVNLTRYVKARIAGLAHNTQLDLHEASEKPITINESDRLAVIRKHGDRYLPEYADRLERLVESTLDAGSMPVLVTQPALYGPAIDDVTRVDLGRIPVTGEMDGDLAWEVLQMYNDVTRRVAKENGLLLIDLAVSMPKSSALYYDTIHFTNAGAESVAMIVDRALSPWLADRFSDYVKTRQLLQPDY